MRYKSGQKVTLLDFSHETTGKVDSNAYFWIDYFDQFIGKTLTVEYSDKVYGGNANYYKIKEMRDHYKVMHHWLCHDHLPEELFEI
jgi:hypothetical protein